MKRSLFFLVALCLIATSVLWAQSVGDYGSAVNGDWTSTATWVVCATDGTWDGATAATAYPGSSDNVWICSGDTVIFDTSSKSCNNLTVESEGSLIANKDVTSPTYVKVCGTTLTVNGNYGGVDDGLGLKPSGDAGATLTITGTGTCNISRIQPQNANQTLVFDMDCGINYGGSSGTGSAALYPNGKDGCTFTINAGKTLTMGDNAYISLGSSGDSAGNLNLTINVDGTLTCSGSNSKFNLNNSTGFTSTLNINNGGTVNVNSYLRGGAKNEGTVNITVASGGTLNGTVTGTFDISTADVAVNGSLNCAGMLDAGTKQIAGTGSLTLDAGATLMTAHPDGIEGSIIVTGTIALNTAANYTYNGTVAQVTGTSLPATVFDLTIDNDAGVTLSQATTVNGFLTLTSGDLALNGKALVFLTGIGDGTILETATLTAPTDVNVGSLGATITSTADLGATVVKRGFSAQTVNDEIGILRWYMITPTTNTGLNATLVFNYDESELNGLTETDLVLYSSADTGKTWTEQGGTLDAANNKITLTGIDAFSMWTAGGTPVIPAPAVFISEYIEGSSNNKAIEIYNATSETIDLSLFTVKQANNGSGWGCKDGTPDTRYVLPLTGTLAAGDVFVVYNSAADAAIVAVGDLGLAYNSTVNGGDGDNVPAFTGDDAIGLFYNDVLIDVIGVPDTDPGTNWPVAGTGATSEFTLVRKSSVVTGNTNWALSAGTDADDSEWEVYPQNTFAYLGEHPTLPKVFFSEYIEGSSSNKALEIYNGTGAEISLNDFRINQSTNGGGWAYQHIFPTDATLASGDVWVILNDATDASLFSSADADEFLAYPSVVHHNGDDARALEWTPDGGTTWIILDIIGDPDTDPGDGWDVAGVTAATKDHTLVRKASVLEGNTDWAASAGTNATDSEWEVYDVDTFTFLGEHPTIIIPLKIAKARSISLTEIELVYTDTLESINAADYSILGSSGITISSVVLDATDGTIVKLTASADIVGDTVLDTLIDAATPDTIAFYIGITPLALTNTLNPDGKIEEDYTATFKGIVYGNDAYSDVWFADGSGAYHGLSIYNNAFVSEVAVGDEIIVSATLDVYNNMTELKNPGLISKTSGATLYDAFKIHGADIDTSLAADTNPAEQYENQLVKIDSALVLAYDNYQYYCTDDGISIFKVSGQINFHLADVPLEIGSIYNITGPVDYYYGFYCINPRDSLDAEYLDTPPSAFSLISPADGDTITDAEIVSDSLFQVVWQKAEDPDGDIDYYEFNMLKDDALVDAKQFTDTSNYVKAPSWEDNGTYYWFVVAFDNYGAFSVSDTFEINFNRQNPNAINGEPSIPKVFALHQNYPNPFNPITTIKYDLPKDAHVKIVIYNIIGREVRTLVNEKQSAGYQAIQWNARDNYGKQVSSGYYIYMMQAGDFHKIHKMILIK